MDASPVLTCASSHLTAYAARPAPRYTSYPTAPHFSTGVDAGVYRQWLSELTPDQSLSLYLHVPYCRSLCAYCGCHTLAVRREEPLQTYTDVLQQEIALIAGLTPAKRVHHIHWGGGTPSVVGSTRLLKLYAALNAHFDLSQMNEHAIELDPRFVDAELIETLKAMNITRVSLGVQDLNSHVQEAIGRVQPFEQVARTVEMVHSAGIDAINMDLIYGLPLQTTADVVHTVTQVLTLAPSRLAVFGYAHVPWFKSRQKLIQDPHLPDAAERLEQAATLRALILDAGYRAIGLDHFARPEDPMSLAAATGTLRRNFQGYTTDAADALVGLGASSISQLPQGYAQNAPELPAYMAAITAGAPATKRGHGFCGEDPERAHLIEALMCQGAVDISATTIDLAPVLARLAPYLADGLCAWNAGTLIITPQGQPFTRLIAACFDGYQESGKGRHAAAV